MRFADAYQALGKSPFLCNFRSECYNIILNTCLALCFMRKTACEEEEYVCHAKQTCYP